MEHLRFRHIECTGRLRHIVHSLQLVPLQDPHNSRQVSQHGIAVSRHRIKRRAQCDELGVIQVVGLREGQNGTFKNEVSNGFLESPRVLATHSLPRFT